MIKTCPPNKELNKGQTLIKEGVGYFNFLR